MKLVSYYDDGLRVGAVVDDSVWDVRRAFELYLLEVEHDPAAGEHAEARVPRDMATFIQLNHGRLEPISGALERLIAGGVASWPTSTRAKLSFPLEETKLFAPIVRPSKIVNIGSAYREHVVEYSKALDIPFEVAPTVRVSFLTSSSAILSPGEPIEYPRDSERWDYEGELAIIIGRSCRDVTTEDASKYIFGYCVFNDASNRDVPAVLGGGTSPKSKSADTLAPFGPWIVTADSVSNPNALQIRVWVNGELRQDANTSTLMWSVEEMVAVTSQFMNLLPGDVIPTSSPSGVALETGQYLGEGDVVRIEIEELGMLENPVKRRA